MVDSYIKSKKLNKAIFFLLEYLRDGPKRREYIMLRANEMDISWTTFYNAKSLLNIMSEKDKEGNLVWRLPDE